MIYFHIFLIYFDLLQARKTLRRLKGIVRLQILTQNYPVKRQATTTLSHLHSWSKIQAQIRSRRLCMVTEGRLRQKKLENQLKLEAKLHGLEVRPPAPMCKDLHDMNLLVIVPNYLSTTWHLFPLRLWSDVWIPCSVCFWKWNCRVVRWGCIQGILGPLERNIPQDSNTEILDHICH
jgi:hypothetical protein